VLEIAPSAFVWRLGQLDGEVEHRAIAGVERYVAVLTANLSTNAASFVRSRSAAACAAWQ
jgi:hypothetical protein